MKNGDMINITQSGSPTAPLGSYCVRGTELDIIAAATNSYSIFEKQ
jgi:hypothetical protein